MQPHHLLTLKAAALARSSQSDWQQFLQALAAYSEAQRTNLVNSPLPDLPVNQGRAQAIGTLQDLLENCLATADKIKKV